ncbi:MAG: type II toxin-antitoxin system HicB family antitoxin [Planctomycetes bacterium]|nr:type II toxin-antitoxin system HicB family antitoxin [Planctomycetota bacterium]
MLRDYVDRALRRAKYEILEDGSVCAMVPGLRGVIAHADTVEACRAQLAEVVEEWVLVRVARGLRVPAIDGVRVRVRKAV